MCWKTKEYLHTLLDKEKILENYLQLCELFYIFVFQ
jgi:hypothetical protein